MLAQEQRDRYFSEGYLLVEGLFSPEETERLRDHYMQLRLQGEFPGDSSGVDNGSTDPLKRFPRMIHMHRWDDASMQWLLDSRLDAVMTELLGKSPYAVQTMLYFKPAGARGQALHQDQFYLRVEPGTCLAAWMALDPCDEENGCLQVVPGTKDLPVLCTQTADTSQSFTDVTVPVPEGMPSVPVRMNAGDVFFFNGSTIHGSYPNVSEARFRRALIGHYIVGDAEKVASYYHPVLRMDGSVVELEVSTGGGPCGRWTEQEGRPVVEVSEAREKLVGAMHE